MKDDLPSSRMTPSIDWSHKKQQSSFASAEGVVPTEEYPSNNNVIISNNSSFRLKHPGVPDGSDGSGGTSYPLTENYTLPVAQATGRVA